MNATVTKSKNKRKAPTQALTMPTPATPIPPPFVGQPMFYGRKTVRVLDLAPGDRPERVQDVVKILFERFAAHGGPDLVTSILADLVSVPAIARLPLTLPQFEDGCMILAQFWADDHVLSSTFAALSDLSETRNPPTDKDTDLNPIAYVFHDLTAAKTGTLSERYAQCHEALSAVIRDEAEKIKRAA